MLSESMGISICLEDKHGNVLETIDRPKWLDRVLPVHEDEHRASRGVSASTPAGRDGRDAGMWSGHGRRRRASLHLILAVSGHDPAP